MSHALESADADLDGRVHELIERGLSLYGGGDLEGAMSAWRHALALDGDNRRAADYVAYVKRHFDLVDEQVLDQGNFAPADVELEIPFGLVTMSPLSDEGIEAYESFEVSGTPAKSGDSPIASSAIDEFEEEIPTRVRNAPSAEEVDEGWSLEEDEKTSGGRRNPLIEVRTDRASSVGDSSPIENVVAENALDDREADEISGAIASVSAELDGLEFPDESSYESLELDGQLSADPLELGADPIELDADPPKLGADLQADHSVGDLELELPSRSAAAAADKKRTMPGFPEPPAPSIDNDKRTMMGFGESPPPGPSDAGRETAEISPLELGEALSALKLDGDAEPADRLELDLGLGGAPAAPAPPPRAESLSDVEFDLGESSADSSAPSEFGSKPYASVAVVGEDEPVHGDAQISFREPKGAGLVEVDPLASSASAESDLEMQLAELERELKTGSREVAWTKHDGTGPEPSDEGLDQQLDPLGGGPVLQPLEPRKARESMGRPQTSTGPPKAGLEAVRAAILAAIDNEAHAAESHDERVRRRIAGFLACAEREIERDEYQTAAVAADMALEESPESALGQKLIHERSDLLVNVFRRFLGDQSCVVAVALPMHELAKYQLDHRTAFLLSRVDGTLTIEDVLDVSGMARLEAYRCLARLVLEGVLEVR